MKVTLVDGTPEEIAEFMVMQSGACPIPPPSSSPESARDRPSILEQPGVASAGVNSVAAATGRTKGPSTRYGPPTRRRLALAAGIVPRHEPEASSPADGEGFGVVR